MARGGRDWPSTCTAVTIKLITTVVYNMPGKKRSALAVYNDLRRETPRDETEVRFRYLQLVVTDTLHIFHAASTCGERHPYQCGEDQHEKTKYKAEPVGENSTAEG